MVRERIPHRSEAEGETVYCKADNAARNPNISGFFSLGRLLNVAGERPQWHLVICVLLALCFTENASAQYQFTRVIGGASYDFGKAVLTLPSGDYLVAGTSSSYDSENGSQVVLIGVNENGFGEWIRTDGGPLADVASTMVFANTGTEVLVAGFSETISSSYQCMAIKYDLQGDTIWTRYYGGPQWDICRSAVALDDGGFALFGQTYSEGAGNGDFYLIRINGQGDTLWTRTYGGAGEESGESIAVALDGGFFLAGTTDSFGAGGKDMYVVRTDAQGDTLWTSVFGGPEDDICYAVAATADSGYVIGGGSFNLTPGKADFLLRKEGGNQQWIKTESKGGDNFITDIIIEPGTQNVTAIGIVTEGIFGGQDGRILRYGADGIWNGVARTHGTMEQDGFADIKQTADGGYIIVGSSQGYLERFDDVWLVKTDDLGVSIGPELAVDEIEIGDEAFAVQFTPNPTAFQTTLSIQGFGEVQRAITSPIILRVFDAYGKEVLSRRIESGSTDVQLNAMANGLYFYQLTTGSTRLASGKLFKAGL